MATVVKNFKVKSGLIVEGATATVGGQDILTKKQDDQNYIVNLIGGTATSANEANKVVKRDANGNFAAGEITADLIGDVTGNADTATTLETARKIELVGDATGSVNFNGSQDVAITVTLDGSFATDSEVATAKGQAIDAASADATSKANAAQAAAESFATTAANNAQAAAELTASNTNSALYTTVTGDIATAKSEAISSANSYTDGKVADLVDSAPELLDTLNELAEAIANNPNYATDVANLVATKADITYVDAEISDLNTAAQGYATAAQAAAAATASADATSKANAAQAAAEATAAADATSKANAAQAAAIEHADALTTSDIAEGSAQYFTTSRAKSAAAALITSATKTNIVITGDENGLTITAENGVADSTTSDLAEGSRLYFTDARAVSALEAVTPNFVEVELNSVAKQVAATAAAATASTVTAYSWAKADFRSAKFLVKVSTGTHSDVSEVVLTLDSSDNVAITEYAMVGTNGALSTVSADVSGNNVRLLVTTTENNSNVTVAGTLIK
jgi:hypothetical protein